MTNTTQQNSIDWMIDAGVSATEVMWLKSMEGSDKLSHPVAARRVKEIQEKAFKGLCSSTDKTKFAPIH
jgi:hypothetical protein